jgi:toxin-antitoxin system PIN domain toxin
MFVVDTNVLVYAADEGSSFHARCQESIRTWRERPDAWFVTWGILYEFLRVTTHPNVMRRPWTATRAWEFVSALLKSPGLSVLAATERHEAVAERTIAEIPDLSGNVFHDAHTAILMREHGIRRIYTRDTDFHRFPFLDPLDPTTLSLAEPKGRVRSRKHRRASR